MTFPDFARSLGLILPPVIEPGKTHRVPTTTHERKHNGLIRLDEDGGGGIAINYESGEGPMQWRANGEKVEYDPAKDNAARSERLAERREKEKSGTRRALAEWTAATPLSGGLHPYIQAKRLTMDACRGLRVCGSNLLIPMFQRRNFCSLQRISKEGEKLFVKGAPTKGAYHEITRPKWSVTILCEGFATGATIFSAMASARVIVCFSAENLVTVAERGEWSGLCVIAADNDIDSICARHKKEGCYEAFDPDSPRPEWCRCNPGKTTARRVEKIIGCGAAIPRPESGTDWNDIFLEQYARLEKTEELKPWKTSPHKLRASAMSFISPAMMRAAKMVVK